MFREMPTGQGKRTMSHSIENRAEDMVREVERLNPTAL
jgi:hypothetical protein